MSQRNLSDRGAKACVALSLSGKVSSASGLQRLYGPSEQLGKGEGNKDDCGQKRQRHRHPGRVGEEAE